MIPEEAIAAAAKEIDAPSEPAAQEIARRALEAAAPHMLAGAWDEGMSYALPGTPRGMETFEAYKKSNPYRPTP